MKNKLCLMLGTMLVVSLCACNKDILDTDYKFEKIHIYEVNKCYEIISWRDYEDGEQFQINVKGYGKILISSNSCFLVKDKCPICDSGGDRR